MPLDYIGVPESVYPETRPAQIIPEPSKIPIASRYLYNREVQNDNTIRDQRVISICTATLCLPNQKQQHRRGSCSELNRLWIEAHPWRPPVPCEPIYICISLSNGRTDGKPRSRLNFYRTGKQSDLTDQSAKLKSIKNEIKPGILISQKIFNKPCRKRMTARHTRFLVDRRRVIADGFFTGFSQQRDLFCTEAF